MPKIPTPPRPPRPKGTRDLYPLEAARRRWLSERWRRVSIRHGFEEIDGPTFETTDLYAVKSGEGILNELFQAFSGKDPKDIERIRAGEPAPFAMRPEFTPTLARMYAERARTLASPCKWFQIGPCFRAEKPQRGRLREFLQWNVDVIGGGSNAEDTESAERGKARLDAELIACCVSFLESCGLTPENVNLQIADRNMHADIARNAGISEEKIGDWFVYLDGEEKRSDGANDEYLKQCKIPLEVRANYREIVKKAKDVSDRRRASPKQPDVLGVTMESVETHLSMWRVVQAMGIGEWCEPLSMSIVRGLAYYTGTVFEVIADGERAIAGGGRYDNLIELFGGPPTPAVGFAMGDVVISLLLQDKGLMPSDAELMEEIGARPDVFVIAPNEDLDEIATRLLAALRKEGLHARRSYKSTRNVGKLLKEANQQHARLAIILESPTQATIKNLDSPSQESAPIDAGFGSILTDLRDAIKSAGR